MGVKFYHAISSPPSRAVLLLLKTLNIPYEGTLVDLAKGEHIKTEYTKINPRRTVPTLIDDGFSILDSHAINSYLVTKYAKDDEFYPKDIQMRSIVDQGLYFDSGTLFPRFLYTTKTILTKVTSKIDDDTEINFERSYKSLERLLNGRQFTAGNGLTIADYSIITTLTSMNILVPIKSNKFPSLLAYIERCESNIPYYLEIMKEAQEAFIKRLLSSGFSLQYK